MCDLPLPGKPRNMMASRLGRVARPGCRKIEAASVMILAAGWATAGCAAATGSGTAASGVLWTGAGYA